jgi:hypothetical protein
MKIVRLSGNPVLAFAFSLALMMPCVAGSAQDASRQLPQLIKQKLKGNPSRIVIPSGRYYVKPNNQEHLRLEGLKDVTIVADGVEMICTQTTRALTIENCENVTIEGLEIDYDPLPFTQGRITSISDDTLTHHIRLFDDYPVATQVIERNYEIYKPDTRTLRYGSYHGVSVERVGKRRLRVTLPEHWEQSNHRPEKVGDLIAIETRYAPDGAVPHAVMLQQCQDVKLEDVKLYAYGFGFFEKNCNGSIYHGCKVDRKPLDQEVKPRQHARLRSLNSDAFHSKFAAEGPTYRECVARFQGDDGFAINGHYHLITEQEGASLRVLAKRPGQMNIEKGDTVELVNFEGQRLPDAEVLAVEATSPINEREEEFIGSQNMNYRLKEHRGGMLTQGYRVTLDRPVELPIGSVIASQKQLGNGFKVIDCTVAQNRSRGILVKASHGVIRNNRLIENWGEAIKVAPEWQWLEAGSSSDVAIANNVIDGCHSVSIAVYAFGGSGAIAPMGAHKNIRINGNQIGGGPKPAVFVTSTTGLQLENNRIRVDSSRALRPWHANSLNLGSNPESVVLRKSERSE